MSSCEEDTMTLNITKLYLPIPEGVEEYAISWQDESCDQIMDFGDQPSLSTSTYFSIITILYHRPTETSTYFKTGQYIVPLFDFISIWKLY